MCHKSNVWLFSGIMTLLLIQLRLDHPYWSVIIDQSEPSLRASQCVPLPIRLAENQSDFQFTVREFSLGLFESRLEANEQLFSARESEPERNAWAETQDNRITDVSPTSGRYLESLMHGTSWWPLMTMNMSKFHTMHTVTLNLRIKSNAWIRCVWRVFVALRAALVKRPN